MREVRSATRPMPLRTARRDLSRLVAATEGAVGEPVAIAAGLFEAVGRLVDDDLEDPEKGRLRSRVPLGRARRVGGLERRDRREPHREEDARREDEPHGGQHVLAIGACRDERRRQVEGAPLEGEAARRLDLAHLLLASARGASSPRRPAPSPRPWARRDRPRRGSAKLGRRSTPRPCPPLTRESGSFPATLPRAGAGLCEDREPARGQQTGALGRSSCERADAIGLGPHPVIRGSAGWRASPGSAGRGRGGAGRSRSARGASPGGRRGGGGRPRRPGEILPQTGPCSR